MRLRRILCLSAATVLILAAFGERRIEAAEPAVLPPIDRRFTASDTQEVPDFQRHIVNLFGRLGCNGRACHGSFQGRGGFRLSLFGYDFQADHAALFDNEGPRVQLDDPDQSLIIAKPTDADLHEGGQRYAKGSWQYHVLRRWIAAGAKGQPQPQQLVTLQVTPPEIWFESPDQQIALQAVAVWQDGTREDVTPLCRFQTNDSQVADVDQQGVVTAGQAGDTHVVVFYDRGVVPVPVIRPVSSQVSERYPSVPTPTKIDELVVAKLRKLGIVPSELCSDTEFLRRVRLDLTGTLPAPQEVELFLADSSADKRARKIDQLLQTPEYAAWWATKLCDYTGNNDDQLNNVGPIPGAASQEWYDWIHHRVADNVPYDELAAGIVTALSRKPGQDYLDYCRQMSELYQPDAPRSFAELPSMTHYWSRADFRDVDARVIGFAYSFMGIRIQCAQCHKHPFDQWSKDDFDQFKAIFAGVTANVRPGGTPQVRKQYDQLIQQLGLSNLQGNDLRRKLPQLLKQGQTVPFAEISVNKRTAKPARGTSSSPTARLLGGATIDLAASDDPRQEVMRWLRSDDNRFFAPAFANRVWAAYFHVGIVNPPDDLSLANPPSNQALLDYLARGFIDSGFDMKWLHREIANSRTYQSSCEPNETNAGDEKHFSHAIPRRLPAEVIYDAIHQATSSDERIAAMQSNVSRRAIAIPGAGNRGNRNRPAAYALTIFGRSTRESNCDCDRSAEASLLQTVYLQNDQDVLKLLQPGAGSWVGQAVARLRGQQPAATDSASGGQQAQLRNQIAAGTVRLARLRKSGDAAAARQLQRRLELLKQQVQEPAPAVTAPEPQTLAAADLDAVIRQTYLRTVSRYPSDDELSRTSEYLRQSSDVVQGLQDLLWALLNTKEFQLNH